jgi:hypothetical protein
MKGWDRERTREVVAIALVFVMAVAMSGAAVRAFRIAGLRPHFYQVTFEPAVMMACGRGFTAMSPGAAPESMRQFLRVERNTFDCGDLPASAPAAPVEWYGSWRYLYTAAAVIWRITGISWTALDALAIVFGGVTAVSLYGLLRLVAARWIAAAVSLLLIASPANLTYLLGLRDYSKTPFLLASIFILATLVARPMTRTATIAGAALFGAVVGVGFGFRADLFVMVPFGVFVVAFFLPGALRTHLLRNAAAMAAILLAFILAAWPAMKGLSGLGCQYHLPLLGLTTPFTVDLGLEPGSYQFGDRFLDPFVDLKVGDYANRVLGRPVPPYCSPGYDQSSRELLMRLATTFPADIVARAYGSILTILKLSLTIPQPGTPTPFPIGAVYHLLNVVTRTIAFSGPILMGLAIGLAWATSPRIGIALAIFVLFLGGYPGIEFEQRHWFPLRFMPWWAALFVISGVMHARARGWSSDEAVRGCVGIVATGAVLGLTLVATRMVQARTVASLAAGYDAAKTEALSITRAGSAVDVGWHPEDYGPSPEHRSSDLLVVTVDPARCVGAAPIQLRTRYEFDNPAHDLSNTIVIDRPRAGGRPARVFVPVFAQTHEEQPYLRFTGFEAIGSPADCVGRVDRVVDRGALALWIEMQMPDDPRDRRLYQTFRLPRFLK